MSTERLDLSISQFYTRADPREKTKAQRGAVTKRKRPCLAAVSAEGCCVVNLEPLSPVKLRAFAEGGGYRSQRAREATSHVPASPTT